MTNRLSHNGRVNLRHLFWLRCLAIVGQLTTIVAVQRWFGVHLPWQPMLSVIALEAAFNAVTWLRVMRAHPETPSELFGQLCVDLGALSSLLFLSGGTTNPFVALCLPALAIGAAVLPWTLAAALSLFVLGCYALLASISVPLQLDEPSQLFDYYRTGTWINFVVSVGLIVWFVARMSRALRARDQALADAQRRLLQDERVVALGAQAASVAHELGTPLSTIAVLAEELRLAAQNDPGLAPYREDLISLEKQLALCKTGLARLQTRAAMPTRRPVAIFLEGFIEQWRLRHPQVELQRAGHADFSAELEDSAATGQILTILLDNAARASPSSVTLETRCADDTVEFHVRDAGLGIPATLRTQLGRIPVDSTQGGAGVGLYLAFASAARLSGGIELQPVHGGGTDAILKLPALRSGVAYEQS